jgi:aspartate ammonia-lyase
MRIERDLLGEKSLRDDEYYGINTKRALENFYITGRPVHHELVRAMAVIKKAAAITNEAVGLLDHDIAGAILKACDEILEALLKTSSRWTRFKAAQVLL